MTRNPILYRALLLAPIALGCSAQAQTPATTDHKLADIRQENTSTSNASVVAVSMNPATQLGKFLSTFQKSNKPEPLVFKSVPGDKNTRMAEFTTPSGLRMRAFTNGPDNVRFSPVDQSQGLADIYLHCPRVVERLSGGVGSGGPASSGVGASVDSFKTGLGAIADAIGRLFGKKLSNCSQTITITVDEDGKTTTTVSLKCTKL